MQPAEYEVLPWHVTDFNRLLSQASGHASLVHGAQGIGKLRFALAIARALLCESKRGGGACGACASCGWFGSGAHPDFRLIEPAALGEPDEEQEGGRASTRIRIEQIRELGDFIHLSSHRGGAKVVLVHPAESLNINAANALLKNLEEPPEGTSFLLVAHRIQALIPTLRSRCRHIALPVPDQGAARAWLAAQGIPDPELALAHTGGAPLLAQQLVEAGYWQQHAVFLEEITARSFDPLVAAERISDYPVRDVVSWLQKWTFDLVLKRVLGKIRYNPDRADAIAPLAAQIEPLTMMRFHREVLQLQRVVDHPLNPRLLLEQLLLDYARAAKVH